MDDNYVYPNDFGNPILVGGTVAALGQGFWYETWWVSECQVAWFADRIIDTCPTIHKAYQ